MSSQDKPLPAAKRFVYPFPGKDGKEITDADIYYTALAQADEGYYPLGANGQWHGGVHFNKRTAGEFDQDGGVRCIADGEVVAWRLDDQYPQITYPVARDEDGTELHGELKAVYSTGFVLVRHRLELPPPPKDDAGKGDNTTTTADTAVDAQQPSLVFYSLYMHLMCWNNYETHPARSRPEIWDGDLAYRVGKKATDSADKYPNKHAKGKGLGINLRKKGDHGTFVGFAARHAILRLGATDGNGYFVVESCTGDVTPGDMADAVVYKNELTPVPGKPKTLNEIKVLDKPVAVKAGQLMGHLGVYERFKDAKPGAQATKPTIDAPESPRQMVHVEIFTPEDIEAFIEKSQARAAELPDSDKTRLFIEEGAQLAAPAKADAGIEPGQGAIIANAEQTSGYWTRVKKLSALAIIDHKHCRQFKNNQYTVDSAAKTLLAKQLGIPVTKMSNTARWDGHYYDTQGAPNPDIHRYQTTGNDNAEYPSRGVHVVLTDEVWIESSHLDKSGTAQASTSRLPAWTKFPLEINNADGPKAGASKISKISTLDNQATSQDGIRWWQVTIRSEAGTDETGWACTKQDKVRLCSPWDWPGFDTLEDSTKPVELHAYRLMSTSQILPEEKADAENLAKNAKKGAVLSKLHQIMALDEGDRVKPNDIRNALKSPEQARALSHLIIRHESEWGGEMTKWDALDKFMKGPLENDWKIEKDRIRNLQWMDRLNEGPISPAWHTNVTAVLTNLIQDTNIDELIRKIGDIISHGEGSYESYNTGTKDVPGGYVGHSYISPPAGTVTSKTINEIIATENLSGTDTGRFFATGKYQTIISTLKSAKAKMNLTGEEKYDASMQERVFREFLFQKAGGGKLSAFVQEGEGTIEDAQLAAAKEWASIAVPKNHKIKNGTLSDGTVSYYQSGANSANQASTKKLVEILKTLD